MTKKTTVQQFITNHLFQIIVLTMSGIVGFVWLKAEVVSIDFRVTAVEIKQDEYPSEEWFELKFETMGEKIDNNTKAIKELDS